MTDTPLQTIETVCIDCAYERGAKPHENHIAGYWKGDCDLCGDITLVSASRDWKWPQGKRPVKDTAE